METGCVFGTHRIYPCQKTAGKSATRARLEGTPATLVLRRGLITTIRSRLREHVYCVPSKLPGPVGRSDYGEGNQGKNMLLTRCYESRRKFEFNSWTCRQLSQHVHVREHTDDVEDKTLLRVDQVRACPAYPLNK